MLIMWHSIIKIIFLMFFLASSLVSVSNISFADDSIEIPLVKKDLALFVSRSEIRQNLTNYRTNNFIQLTLTYVLLTREASQEYKRTALACLPMNQNDYKYVLVEVRFRFDDPEGLQVSENRYDEYNNFICGGSTMSVFNIKQYPIITKIKSIFEEIDRKDKSKPKQFEKKK